MLSLARMGAAIVPPMPAFYNHPATVDDIVDHIVARICDQFAIDSTRARRWEGMHAAATTRPPALQRNQRRTSEGTSQSCCQAAPVTGGEV